MAPVKTPLLRRRQAGAVPLAGAVQAWLIMRGLAGGPHTVNRTAHRVPYRVPTNAAANHAAQAFVAQLAHEITHAFHL